MSDILKKSRGERAGKADEMSNMAKGWDFNLTSPPAKPNSTVARGIRNTRMVPIIAKTIGFCKQEKLRS
jgi:hypothetical protein